jgi:hypothetical protein
MDLAFEYLYLLLEKRNSTFKDVNKGKGKEEEDLKDVLHFYGYQPKNELETKIVEILQPLGSEDMCHVFSIPGECGGLRLTPLHWAIYSNSPGLVETIASFSCVSFKNKIKGGQDPFDFCIVLDRLQCFEVLIKFEFDLTKELCQKVLRCPNPEFLRILLEIRPDIPLTNDELQKEIKFDSIKQQHLSKYIQNHPNNSRSYFKGKDKLRWMKSNKISYENNYFDDDDDDDDYWLNQEYAWTDDLDGDPDSTWPLYTNGHNGYI